MVKPSKLFPEGISNSMRRCTARIFSALLAASLALAFSARVALASPIWEFNGSIFAFTHLVTRGRDLAIGIDDPALDRLLHQLGAVVTWKPGARYVLVATGEPTVVSFAIGQHTYDIGPIALRSNLAAFARGGEAFLDFNALLQALQLRAIPAGATTVLQPQIGTLDVRDEGDRIRVIARGALPLEAQLVRSSARQMTYAFSGVGSMLSPSRTVDAGGLTAIELQQRGSAVHPITYLTLDLDGSSHVAQMGSLGGRDIGIVIVPGAQVATSQASSATPMPTRTVQPTVASVPQPLHPASNGELPTISPWNRVASAPLATTAPGAIAMVTPAASVALAHITAIGVQSTATGLDVHITLTGAASFDWHHLRA
ncbi:MAG TPA: hypothetical protein VMV73_03555, partial [Candidatus Dormibacteraeota bacterium]|nr:hypothetical protein [Candidatus Dormibacteraeota bacterium]